MFVIFFVGCVSLRLYIECCHVNRRNTEQFTLFIMEKWKNKTRKDGEHNILILTIFQLAIYESSTTFCKHFLRNRNGNWKKRKGDGGHRREKEGGGTLYLEIMKNWFGYEDKIDFFHSVYTFQHTFNEHLLWFSLTYNVYLWMVWQNEKSPKIGYLCIDREVMWKKTGKYYLFFVSIMWIMGRHKRGNKLWNKNTHTHAHKTAWEYIKTLQTKWIYPIWTYIPSAQSVHTAKRIVTLLSNVILAYTLRYSAYRVDYNWWILLFPLLFFVFLRPSRLCSLHAFYVPLNMLIFRQCGFIVATAAATVVASFHWHCMHFHLASSIQRVHLSGFRCAHHMLVFASLSTVYIKKPTYNKYTTSACIWYMIYIIQLLFSFFWFVFGWQTQLEKFATNKNHLNWTASEFDVDIMAIE